jgi:ADP-heptose:LPS heptosyltransferase
MQSSKTDVKRILAVTTGGLGDTILFSPVLKALRFGYPGAKIELLAASDLVRIVFTKAIEVNRIVKVDTNRSSQISKIAALIPFAFTSRIKGGFDIGAFATGLNPYLSYFLKYTAGIRQIVQAPQPPEYPTDLACNLALAQRFCNNIKETDVFLPLTAEAESEAKEVLAQQGISWDESKIVAVCPSTDLKHRPRWPLSKLIEVIQLLKKNGFDGKVIVIGSAKEGLDWAEIDRNRVADANLAGKLSIFGSAFLLTKSCLAIGNDGGLIHTAGAVGCPLVVIMTNTPVSYRPAGKKTKVIHSNLSCCRVEYPRRPKSCDIPKCLDSINVADVFQACSELMPLEE